MMKTPNEHPGPLLLDYIDGSLSSEDRAVVEAHVGQCDHCRTELRELESLAQILKSEKSRIFCPEPWEIQDLAGRGTPPDYELAEHLRHCPECREEFERFHSDISEESLPPKIKGAFLELISEPVADSRQTESWFQKIADRLAAAINLPVLGLASVAAALIVVALLYPMGQDRSTLLVSSLRWDQNEAGLQGAPKGLEVKPKAAIALMARNLSEPLSRPEVDSMYRAVYPPAELRKKFDFVDPASEATALDRYKERGASKTDLARKLHSELGVSKALFITLSQTENGYTVKYQLIDTKSGDSLGDEVSKGVSKDSLEAELRAGVAKAFTVARE